MTREERGSVKRTIDGVRMRCDHLRQSLIELDASLPVQSERAGLAGEKWLQLADVIARQIGVLGEEVAPLLDHWVFEPADPGSLAEPLRLPELLRTKMREEQEQKDAKLREEIAKQRSEKDVPLEVLSEKQNKANEALNRILNELNNSEAVKSIASKKQRISDRIQASANKKPDSFDGTPLLRLLKQNDRKLVKIEEVEEVRLME